MIVNTKIALNHLILCVITGTVNSLPIRLIVNTHELHTRILININKFNLKVNASSSVFNSLNPG